MSEPASPRAIGDYVIEREVGRGAFGVVYRAHHRRRPDTPLAVKVVQGRGDTDRLLLEPAVLSRLDHPCIVGLEDYFLRGNDLVVALEFIDGQDLKTMLEDGHEFTQNDVRDLLLQVGSALSVAHSRKVIHRDLKPANVLVTARREGGHRFVLTDFGIGQVREGIQTEKRVGGTYLFMAPEQLRGRPGTQSDLWALGVVAYRMLSGRMPFPGPTLRDLTHQILYGNLVPPSDVAGKPIDPDLERAVMHLLDRSLLERTSSGEELLRELGYSGPADSVLQRRAKKAKASAGESLDRRLGRGIAWRAFWLVACITTYLLPSGLVSGSLLVGGMALFYVAQKEGRWGEARSVLLTFAALVVLFAHVVLRYLFPTYDLGLSTAGNKPLEAIMAMTAFLGGLLPDDARAILGVFVGVLAATAYVVYIFLPAIAGAVFASLRRLQREKLLRDLARQGDAGSDKYLGVLRSAVDGRFEDVGLHLRYAEALFAAGRLASAAVEAKILLKQDPYNFAANLLLANSYHQLRLYPECVEVCDRYLEVSGFCFEFTELREQCLQKEAA